MEADKETGTELLTLNTIRVETAISRWPVHRLARKGHIDINIQEWSQGEGEVKWEVDYSKKHGQPGPLAYKLDTLIINRRIEEAPQPLPRLLKLGSLSDICRELSLADSGKNRENIKNSLFQNAFAGIRAKTHYRERDGTERTLEAAFTRYSVILTGEKLPNGKKADAVHIVLNDVFMRVIRGAMTRPLDYDYLKDLPPAPQRFYEILSYKMYATLHRDLARAKLTYSDFCSHAPQTRHLEWDRVRIQMAKVHRPHLASGYIAKVDYQSTVDADGQPDWIMLYLPGPKARAEYRTFTKRGGPSVLEVEASDSDSFSLIETSELSGLALELCTLGITQATAIELVRDYPEEQIRNQMEQVQWLLETKPEKVGDSAAYLIGAIKKNFAPPKGFVTKAEREQQQKELAEKTRETAKKSREKAEQKAREKAEQDAVAAYEASLTPKQLAELDERLEAQAPADQLAKETGAFKSMGRMIRRRDYIAQLLKAQAAPGNT